jgi:hypothetical protein
MIDSWLNRKKEDWVERLTCFIVVSLIFYLNDALCLSAFFFMWSLEVWSVLLFGWLSIEISLPWIALVFWELRTCSERDVLFSAIEVGNE